MPWLNAALAMALAAWFPLAAEGRQLWGTVAVPGGVQAARLSLALGSSGDRPDELWLLDYLDRYVALGNREIGPIADRYFQFIAGADTFFTARPDGCLLPGSGAPRAERDRAGECLAWLGLRLRQRTGAYGAEPDSSGTAETRRAWLLIAGIDALALADTLNLGGRATARLGRSDLPLPLPGFWSANIFSVDAPDIASITSRDDTALLYRGLFSLDDDTLAFLDDHPELVRRLLGDVPEVFATFGRSLRISDGQVLLPGGDAARPSWERLVGVPAFGLEPFVLRLFGRDDGRLAYFYDVVNRLDPIRQRFVLGAHLDGQARVDFTRRVYESLKSFDPNWNIREQPLQLRSFDPGSVLAFIGVGDDGTVGPDWWPSLLERVTASDDWPERAEQTLSRLRPAPADAVWLLSWIFARPDEARERFELLRYLQRQFSDLPRDRAFELEAALRTRSEMPALALAVERMGVADPVVVGLLGRGAHALSSSGGRDRIMAAVARWQAALGWVEQVHRHRRLAPEVLAGLMRSLAGAAAARGDAAAGAIAAWVVEEFLPELAGPDAAGLLSEGDILTALLRPDDGASAPIVWEGLAYRLDRRHPVARAIGEIRAIQTGPRLTDLVVLHRARRAIEAGLSSLDELSAVTASLAALGNRVTQLETVVGAGKDAAGAWRAVVRNLGQIRRDRDLERASRDLPRLLRILDAFTDAVLPATLYSMATAPTSHPPALYADAWTRHVIDEPPSAKQPVARSITWDVPFTVRAVGGGGEVHGALLALDVALADAQLRTVPSDDLLAPPLVYDDDRRALVESLAFWSVDAGAAADDGATIVSAVRRGRTRVGQWASAMTSRQELRDALEAAGADPRRINVVLWLAEREPARMVAWLTVTQLYWLGGGGTVPAAWGVSGRAVDGCLCLEPLEPWRTRWHRDRAGSGLAGSMVTDLPFRLAEHLDALGMPYALVPVILRSALRDWTGAIWQLTPSDAGALAEFSSSLPVRRLDDYLLALVADGFLAAPDGGGGGQRAEGRGQRAKDRGVR